jgi:hypothetical protein
MRLPVMLGLRQRDEAIGFDLPALFWLDRAPQGYGTGHIFGLRDAIQYDRQTGLPHVLEAVLKRTFRGYRAKRQSLGGLFRRLLVGHKPVSELLPARMSATLSRGFQKRLTSVHNRICDRLRPDAEALRPASPSRECRVAVSPGLQGNMALVNRTLLCGDALAIASCESVVAVLH